MEDLRVSLCAHDLSQQNKKINGFIWYNGTIQFILDYNGTRWILACYISILSDMERIIHCGFISAPWKIITWESWELTWSPGGGIYPQYIFSLNQYIHIQHIYTVYKLLDDWSWKANTHGRNNCCVEAGGSQTRNKNFMIQLKLQQKTLALMSNFHWQSPGVAMLMSVKISMAISLRVMTTFHKKHKNIH